jgi:hydrogenase 3 maturation protease
MFFEDLEAFLEGCSALVLAGVGNRLRRDDAAGAMVLRKLKGKVPAGVMMIDCGAVPENFSLEFKKAKPSHIVFFDAVDMGKEPGSYALIREGALATCSMSTHKQSVKVLFRVLREGLPGVRIALIGLQPKTTEFGSGLSRPVGRGLNLMAGEVAKAIGRSLCEDN